MASNEKSKKGIGKRTKLLQNILGVFTRNNNANAS